MIGWTIASGLGGSIGTVNGIFSLTIESGGADVESAGPLLNEDGTPLLNEDGTPLENEGV